MDFKKFAAGAGTFINRAKQYTEEKLGQAEKTELDAHFENLVLRAENTRIWTERILAQTEAVLQPNPTTRVEMYFYDTLEKWDKKRRDRDTNTEILGQNMLDAGNEFGPGTSYGSTLIRCGQTEQKLGQSERELLQDAANNFLQPLKAFLEGDMKTVQKERKVLELKRLDLDACKTRLRRAKSIGAKDEAEKELRLAQSEFDRQAEITKLLLEGISSTHAHHLRCLHDFIEAQSNYYAQCHQYMKDLQRQLGSAISTGNHNNTAASAVDRNSTSHTAAATSQIYPGLGAEATAPTVTELSSPSKRAKVLYDYDAADISELSLSADEVIAVYPLPGHTDWMMGERGSQRGKVPTTYLTIID